MYSPEQLQGSSESVFIVNPSLVAVDRMGHPHGFVFLSVSLRRSSLYAQVCEGIGMEMEMEMEMEMRRWRWEPHN